jgi:hypothetical protein
LIDLNKIFKKTGNVVTKEVGDECIIVPMADNVADMDSVFTLNDTGSFFWSLIDGERTAEQIIETVLEEYDVDRKTVVKDFSAFIAEMSDWIEEA